MKRGLPLAAWIIFLWQLSCAQDVVNAWLPTRIGDSWTYQREERNGTEGGGMAHPEIARWRVEETIKGSIPIPEGVLFRKQIRAVDPIRSKSGGTSPGFRNFRNPTT